MNDVQRVRDDDALLDRLARGERADGTGVAEDLLLALRDDAHAAGAAAVDAPLPVPAPAATRVVRLRGALAGSLVAATVLAGTSGVAAAVAGDPLAGLTGVRAAASAAAAPQGRAPLLRSREGARLHLEVERVAALLAAGRVDDARAALAAMPSQLAALGEPEQRLLRAELASTAPDLVEAAGLGEPRRPGGAPADPADPATQAPDDVEGGPGAPTGPARPADPGRPTGTPSGPPTSAPSTTWPSVTSTPPRTGTSSTTRPPTSRPPSSRPPSSRPPTSRPPTSRPPSGRPTSGPPSATSAPTAPADPTADPTTSLARGPGTGGVGPPPPRRPSAPPRPG